MKPGDKVTYVASYMKDTPKLWEHGIVKRETPDGQGYFVVYNCAGNWDKYWHYTAASTNKRDLKEGWLDKEAYELLMPKGERRFDNVSTDAK